MSGGYGRKKGNGAGAGPGWGGPAKGAGSPKPARPHGKEGRAMQIDAPPDLKAAMAEKAERKEATREEMVEFFAEVKRDPNESNVNRMTAANHWLDRVEGKPVQSTINKNTTDMRVTVVFKG